MAHTIETKVTYLNEDDLIKRAKDLPISEIEYKHVIDYKLLLHMNVVILKKDGEYKVLKSRY